MPERPAQSAEMVLVLTTFPEPAEAERVVRLLVEERLIACANLLPGIGSVFRWQGEVQREEEVLVLMKTRGVLVDRLFQRVADLHPYEVPELVSLSVDSVSNAYCRWVRHETIEVNA